MKIYLCLGYSPTPYWIFEAGTDIGRFKNLITIRISAYSNFYDIKNTTQRTILIQIPSICFFLLKKKILTKREILQLNNPLVSALCWTNNVMVPLFLNPNLAFLYCKGICQPSHKKLQYRNAKPEVWQKEITFHAIC